MKQTPRQELLEAARRVGGTYADLCRVLGVTPATMANWAAGDRPVSLRKAVQIEALTGVPAETLATGYADVIYYLRGSGGRKGRAARVGLILRGIGQTDGGRKDE